MTPKHPDVSTPLDAQAVSKHTYQHLFILPDSDTFPFDDLQVLQTAQHVMLDLEIGFHAELGAFFDDERLALEGFYAAWRGQVDDHVRTAFHLESERLDHAAASVTGRHCEWSASGDAERGFPAVEGFVVLVWRLLSDLAKDRVEMSFRN